MKTHSEIENLLGKLGVVVHLTPPPKRYIATLVDETTNATHSVRFQIPDTDGNLPGEPMVLHTLLSRLMPELQLVHAELCDCTLDYYIEGNLKHGVDPMKVLGSKLRYTVKEPAGTRKRGESFNKWLYLPDTIHLHIARATPWEINDDPQTVAANIQEAKTVLKEQAVLLDAEIKRATTKKEKVEETLAELTAEKP